MTAPLYGLRCDTSGRTNYPDRCIAAKSQAGQAALQAGEGRPVSLGVLETAGNRNDDTS